MQPRVVIMENSDALATDKFAKIRKKISKNIREAGYGVKWKVLNSRTHGGVPQNRRRLYMIGIKIEALVREFSFPKAIANIGLQDLLEDPSTSQTALASQAKPCAVSTREKSIINVGLTRLREKHGVSPSDSTPCVVDGHASLKFSSAMPAVSPSLTATRALCDGHYIASRKRYMHLEEMARLQGYPWSTATCKQVLEKMEEASKGISRPQAERALKHALGNAITCSLLARLLPRVLKCAGLTPAIKKLSEEDIINILRHSRSEHHHVV